MRDLFQEYSYVSLSHDRDKKGWNWTINCYNQHPTKGFIHVGYGVGNSMDQAYDRYRTNEDRRPKKKRGKR